MDRSSKETGPAASGEMLNIGETSKACGVSVKMIRHYESIGLIRPPMRTEAGYRVYSASEVHSLRFVSQARDLGFSVEQIRELLALWRDRSRASADVKAIAEDHIETLRSKIGALEAMAAALAHLSNHCHGDDRPDCPILEEFAQAAPTLSENPRTPFGVAGSPRRPSGLQSA